MLYQLPKQTIFERRRKAKRDLVWILLALLLGQIAFFGLMGVVGCLLWLQHIWPHLSPPGTMDLDAILVRAAEIVLTSFYVSIGLALFAWVIQVWLALRRGLTNPLKSIVLNLPDSKDQLQNRFARSVRDVSLAAGLRWVSPVISREPGFNSFCWQPRDAAPVIGITEGLLGRLDAAELDAVVAHHAAHLAFDDGRLLLFAGSSVSLFNGLIEYSDAVGIARRYPVRFVAGIASVCLGALFTLFGKGRNIHADAAAVAMTRNPLALAQALHKASRGTGAGLSFPFSLAPLLLVAPSGPDVQSHPKLETRIRWLVRDAGMKYHRFLKRMEEEKSQRTILRRPKTPRYWFWDDSKEAWKGPMTLAVLGSRSRIDGSTWLASESDSLPKRAAAMPELEGFFKPLKGPSCPRCRVRLRRRRREGLELLNCSHCDGYFVLHDQMRRLVARKNENFSLSTHREGAKIRQLEMAKKRVNVDEACGYPPVYCVACGKKTQKEFYSTYAKVVVDTCVGIKCGGIWLDGGELELIQVLTENPGLGVEKSWKRKR